MTVACPACGTRYRLPARSRLGANPTFRCTRCDHVFDPDDGAEEPAVDAADEPATTFEMGDEAEEPEDEGVDEEPAVEEAEEDDEEAEPEPAPKRKKARGGKRAARATAADDEAPRGASPARFAVRGMVLTTLAYAVLSIYLYTHPAKVGAVLGNLPFVGERLGGGRLDPGDIQLTDVKGGYQRVAGDELVFVITGSALNNAPVPVNLVQIQGRLLGAHEMRQVVWAGAAPRDVHELSAREIDLLQTLAPQRDWALAPGEQGPFIVAFRTPPTALTEFAVEVVAVRRAAHR